MLRFLITIAVTSLSFATYSQVVLNKILVNNKQISLPKNGNIFLSVQENDLLLEFNQLEKINNEYYYRLKGETNDTSWIKSTYPVVHFQNLEDGKYLFQFKAKNSNIFQLTIKKEIPFYYETWAIFSVAIYILVIIGVVVYFFFLYDFRQKLRLQGVRNQIAADLHDEVGSNLNSIAIFVEVLRKSASPESMPILEKIIENSKESVALMQDTVWTINPKNDSVEKLFERMRSFSTQYLANVGIPLEFTVDADLKKISFSMEQRKNIYMIFKEAINNIVKHAHASKASVSIKKQNDKLQIIVTDNGKGFDTNIDFEGNGLENFKNRAEEAEIECMVYSEIDKGTSVEIVAYC